MPSHPVPTLDEVRTLPARAPRNSGRSASAPMPPPAIAIRIPLRVAGLLILGLCALILAALASWSVDDPSLSLATSKAAANWLGYPGAVIADLVFQFLGLAGLVMVVPLALWGWAMARRHIVSRAGLRLLAWVGATVLFSGVFSFVAMPATWPLPTGLGGLSGMMFTNLAGLIAGSDPQPVTSSLFAIILAAPALALFWIAMGLGTTIPAKPQKNSAARMAAEAEGREPNPIVEVAMGAVVHMGYSLRTAFRRAKAEQAARRAAQDLPDYGHDTEPAMDGHRAPPVQPEPAPSVQRRIHAPAHHVEPSFEPNFEPSARIMAQPAYDDTAVDYPDEPEDDIPFVPEAPVPARTQRGDSRFHPVDPAAPRVTAPAPRPAQGQRSFREAQGSLLDEPSGFELPELSLLAEPRRSGPSPEHAPERLEAMARQLEAVLQDFGVKGDIINVRPGPVVTLFELEPAPGIKSSRVISLADDIARSMSAISARVAVVPGRNAIGIELPNQQRETVFFREMLASSDFEKMKGKLPICLGKTIGGEPVIADLARMPHLLIAGTTGSGKSVGINTFILSLLYQMTPEQCRMIMIDPKMLELSIYDGIPHLLTPVVTDPQKAVVALKWAVREMEDRYRKMSKIGVRNIDGFNQRVTEAAKEGKTITRTVQTGFDRETGEAIFESEEFDLEPLPYIVVIVDEMADLMMVAGKDIEGAIQRLAQMARAAGIHIVTATQRPSVDVITGTIKANFPTRISFMVTSKIDSRTILGEQGAEQLLGNGDMLYMASGGRTKRLHGAFVSDAEVEAVVAHLKSQGAPDYLDNITEDDEEGGYGEDGAGAGDDGYAGSGDELYDKAVHIVMTDKKASTSYIQRRLAIGYNKAATLIERMEREGVISPANHAGKREILVGNNADGY
ncbi:DNA translocase FtsK 4TM domain-containing protein [Devosia sp. XJ19-1]|uniref:DNA translocase FtsK n=1 Tax=Devosia ureilytica TaxID=2952754 RepID=A0A9Q4AMV6_9HYPH|nr:DNA translocase FtsK [Devosia ureilytica]MCP8883115.1 DNA translocase FtsK 4TM domain-containing protein [Devosia ureilytica]MCP8886517.1 DNA translocase FtsK 4TM domain-containing protein [Devosia ureilytica]